MQRAGFDFFAPYSFGSDNGFWADPAVFGPTMSQAIIQSGSSVRLAYFHDTQGEVRRQYVGDGSPIDPITGQPLVQPFRLSRGEAHWRTYVYERNIKRFFDSVPVQAQFRPLGRPLIFFYALSPHFTDLQFAGDLLEKIRQWFIQDYGVDPLIVLSDDWRTVTPEPARTKVLQQSEGFFAWGFYPQIGQDGALTPGPFPGGGQIMTHPATGVSVGTAGVGYRYQEPTSFRHRDRRNGQTLTEDWNRIRTSNLRMVAAWYDYEEDSGISRTAQYQYQYIDLMNSLINPAPILGQLVPNVFRTGVPSVLAIKGNGFRPGAILLFSPDGVNVYQLPLAYVSPQELQFSFNGGAAPGSYYVAVQNPGGTTSNVATLSVQP